MRYLLSVFLALSLSLVASAQSAAEKTPFEIARDAYKKVRDNYDVSFNQAQFEKVAKPGINLIVEFPTEKGIDDVINTLGGYAGAMQGPQNASARAAWTGYLTYSLIEASQREGISSEAKAALLAVDAVAASTQMRMAPSQDTITAAREKIDAVAAAPDGDLYIVRAERSFVEAIKGVNPKALERHLQRLAQHPNSSVVKMAEGELKLVKARNEPLVYSTTTIDGQPLDFEKLRGKYVLIFFWNTTNHKLDENFAVLKKLTKTYGKKELVPIMVYCERSKNAREKLDKYIAEKKPIGLHVLADEGFDSELPAMFNATWGPQGVLLDKDGKLAASVSWAGGFEREMEKLTAR